MLLGIQQQIQFSKKSMSITYGISQRYDQKLSHRITESVEYVLWPHRWSKSGEWTTGRRHKIRHKLRHCRYVHSFVTAKHNVVILFTQCLG